MNSPHISIIVPIYNVERYVGQCLESLCEQTLKEIEIICVDDCGSDASMASVREYAARDERVRVLKHEHNRGLSAARNTGMQEARAPYIMFCDSDDWYEPEKCERMLAAIESAADVDLAVCGVQVHYESHSEQKQNDEAFFRHRHQGVVSVAPTIARSCDECAWDKIYRRSIIEDYGLRFPEGLKHEDLYFYNIYIVHARKMCFVGEKLYHYRRRAGSIMSEIMSGESESALDMIRVGCGLWVHFNQPEWQEKWGYYAEWLWKRSIELIVYGHKKAELLEGSAVILRDFLREQGYNEKNLPAGIVEGLTLLSRDRLLERKYLCGAVKEKCRYSNRKVSVLGVSVINDKYDFESVSMKRCGRKQRFRISDEHFHAFEIDNTALLRELRALGEFTYIPDQGNLGDALLASATLQFFDVHHLPYHMLCEVEEPSEVVVYGGGGIWIPNYEHDWKQFLPIFKRAKKVVILPSSFDHCPRLVEAMDERFVVFCREERSYDYLRGTGCRAKIILDHDMALRLPASFLREPTKRPETSWQVEEMMRALSLLPDNKVGYLLRRDSESTDRAYVASVDLSGYFFFPPRTSKEELYYYGKLMLSAVEYFETIVTDRLHVGIAAALMGKEVYLLDNTYKKLSSIYQRSMKECEHVHMVDSLPEQQRVRPRASSNARLARAMRRYHMYVRMRWVSKVLADIDRLGDQAERSMSK